MTKRLPAEKIKPEARKAGGRWRPARGCRMGKVGPCRVAITVCLDDDTFATVSALAKRDNVAFGAKVRELVDWGLSSIS